MQRKLLHIAGFYGVLLATFGALLAGCVDEPTIEPVEKMLTPTRFVNCIADQPGIDIWVDDAKIADNLGYKGVVDYQNIASGTRFVRVTKTGADTSEAFLRGEVIFRSLWYSSLIIYGKTIDFGEKNRPGWTLTQERLMYSDETAKLPADSGRIKLINCFINNADTKVGACGLRDTLLQGGVPVMRDGAPWVEDRITGVFAPPTTDEEMVTQPNLSSYIKYPVGDRGFVVQFGSLQFLQFRRTVERKYYTFIVTGINKGADRSTWDVIQLDDSQMWN